jgi:hypothetical protein
MERERPTQHESVNRVLSQFEHGHGHVEILCEHMER